MLRIRDTGIGMTRNELDQAMKPFRQSRPAAASVGDGTGLGLPLTKAMAEANRAQFAITSARTRAHCGNILSLTTRLAN